MIGLFGMAETIKAIFAKNLNRKMAEGSLNGQQLAKLLDVTPGIVSRWVNGKSFPESEIVDQMRFELGWTLEDLFATENSDKPSKSMNSIDLANAFVAIAEALGFERPRLKKKSKS